MLLHKLCLLNRQICDPAINGNDIRSSAIIHMYEAYKKHISRRNMPELSANLDTMKNDLQQSK